MLEWLKTYLFKDRLIMGVELALQSEGQVVVRCLMLGLSRGVVTVKDKWEGTSLGEMAQKLGTACPVALSLNGRGVLHKQVKLDSAETEMDGSLLASVLPVLKPSEFYVQIYRNGDTGFYSLARREAVDSLLAEMQRFGLMVTSLSFGPFVFNGLGAFLSEGEGGPIKVELEGHRLELRTGKIIGYQIRPDGTGSGERLTVGDEEVEQKFIIPYAAAFAALVAMPDNLVLRVEPVEEALEEHRQKKLFKAGLAAALSFFFILLLGNFFVFNTLSEEQEMLQAQLGSKRNSLRELSRLDREVREQKAFLQATGWLGHARPSFYADRIALTVPAGVRLTELSVYPLDAQRTKQEGKQAFELETMAVHGTCESPIVLNDWIKALNKLEWVVRVDRQNYTYDDAKGEGTFQFFVRLNEGKR